MGSPRLSSSMISVYYHGGVYGPNIRKEKERRVGQYLFFATWNGPAWALVITRTHPPPPRDSTWFSSLMAWHDALHNLLCLHTGHRVSSRKLSSREWLYGEGQWLSFSRRTYPLRKSSDLGTQRFPQRKPLHSWARTPDESVNVHSTASEFVVLVSPFRPGMV